MSFFKDFKEDFTQAMNELMPDGNEMYDEDEVISEDSSVKENEDTKQKEIVDKDISKNMTLKKESPKIDDSKKVTKEKSENKVVKASKQKVLNKINEIKQEDSNKDLDIAPEDMSDNIDEMLDQELYSDVSSQEVVLDDNMEVNTMDMSVQELLNKLSDKIDTVKEDTPSKEKEDKMISSDNIVSNNEENESSQESIKKSENEQIQKSDNMLERNKDDSVKSKESKTSVQLSVENLLSQLENTVAEEAEEKDMNVDSTSEKSTSSTHKEMEDTDILNKMLESKKDESFNITGTIAIGADQQIDNGKVVPANLIKDPVAKEIEGQIHAIKSALAQEQTGQEVNIPIFSRENAVVNTKDKSLALDVGSTSKDETPTETNIVDESKQLNESLENTSEADEEVNKEELIDNENSEQVDIEQKEKEEEIIEKTEKNNVTEEKEMGEEKDIISINSVDETKEVTEEEKFNVEDADTETTYITKGTKLKGDIETDGSIDIIGEVEGNVICKGKIVVGGTVKGTITAGELYANNAKVEGDIKSYGSVKVGVGSMIIGGIEAESAVIAGAINGDIDVKGPVIVDSTAVIMGNIKSRSVQINNGAVIEGFCSQSYSDIDVKSFFA